MVPKGFAAALLAAWAIVCPAVAVRADSGEPPHTTDHPRYRSRARQSDLETDVRRLPGIRTARLDPNIRLEERDVEEAAEPVYQPRSMPSSQWIEDDPMYVEEAPQPRSFQLASITGTRIVDDSFGITDLEAFGVWALPLSERAPLILTPGFGVHGFSAEMPPGLPELPDVVYDFYLDVRVLYKHNDRYSFDLAITPGYYSDLHNKSSDAFRLGARALMITTWTPTIKTVGGIVYLDRDDYPFVPGAGLIWTPTPDWDIHIAMPKPKVAYRFDANPGRERWAYLAGEFGGGAWAFEYEGQDDIMNYSDLRLLVGMEQRGPAGPAFRIEAGYVFARKVEFDRAPGKFEPDDAFMIRGAFTY